MSSTGDTELPSATTEKPALDPISIASSEDVPADSSENLSKIKSAKNIGTTTPEVEGEENEPITTVEEFPSTPISANDQIFHPLPLTMESKEDSLPLPPTPEETSPSGISKEAEVVSLPEPSVDEAEQLDGLGESKTVKEERLDGIEDETVELKETETKDGEQVEEIPGVESSISHGEQPGASPAHVSVTQEPEAEVELPVAEGDEEKEGDSPIVNGDIPVALEAADLDSGVLETAGPLTDENSDPELVGNARGVPAEEAHTDPEPLAEEHFGVGDSNAEIAQPQDNGNIETHYVLDPEPDIEVPAPEETTEGDSEDKTQVVGQPGVVKSKPDDISLDDGSGDIPSGVSLSKEGNEFSGVEAGADENESAIEAEVPLLETSSPPEEVGLPQTSADETAQASREPELVEAEEELVSEGVPEPVTSPEASKIVAATEDVEPGTPKDTQTTDGVGRETGYSYIENTLDGAGEVTGELESMTVKSPETEQSTGAEQQPTGAEQPTESLVSLNQSSEAQLSDPALSPGDASASEQVAPVSGEDEPQEALKDELPLEELSETAKEAESAASEPSPASHEQALAASGVPEDALKVEPLLEELAEMAGETEGAESNMKQTEPSIEAPAVVTELPLERTTDQELKDSVVTEPEAQPEVEGSKETEEQPAMGGQSPDETPEGDQPASGQDPMVTQHMAEVGESIIEPEVKAEVPERSAVEQGDTAFNQIPEETATIYENGPILESPSVSADPGAEEPQEEEAKAPYTPSLAESRTEEPVDKASIGGSELLGESIGTPLVIVEKTSDNQPSHGEDLGPSATVGQKEAFELRRADAEPDRVITVGEPPTPSAVPTGVSTEPVEEPGAEDGLEEDEPVIISHDDAPLEDVEKAEAAVDLPVPEISGESNGLGGENTGIIGNIDAPAYTLQEEEARSAEDDSRNMSQEAPQEPLSTSERFSNSIDPIGNQDESGLSALRPDEEGDAPEISVPPQLASETPDNPVALVPSQGVSGGGNASVHEDVRSEESIGKADASDLGDGGREVETMADETDIPVVSEESKETTLDSELSREVEDFVAPREQEDNFVAGEEISTLESTEDLPKGASGDSLLTSETFANPIVPREDVPSPPTGLGIEPSKDSPLGSADASDPVIPNEDGGDVQGTSVSILPASEATGNPTELAFGEEVPREVETSVGTVVEPDVERAGASNSGTSPMDGPEGFSTGLFPTSESSANPTDPQSGESPPGVSKNSAELDVVPQNESEGEQGVSSLPSEEAQSSKQGLSVDPLLSPSSPTNPIVDTQEISVSPLPSLGTPSGPIDLAPSDGVPKDLDASPFDSSVELNEESYKEADHSSLGAEALVDPPVKAEESTDILGGKALAVGLATDVGIGLGALAGEESLEGKANHVDICETSSATEPASASDPEMGGTGAPAVEKTVDILPAPAEQEVLPVEIASEVPLQKELSKHPVDSTTEIEPGLIADKSAGEILNSPSPDADSTVIGVAGDKASDKKPFQASAIDVPDEASVTVAEVPQLKDKSVVRGDKEIESELLSQNAPSPAHGFAVQEVDVPEVAKAAEASSAPEIVISSPPGSPAKGDVIEPISEVMFDEGSANRARESENTPEGVRKRKIPGGEASRPTSSGTDTVSTRHHRNVMNTFWHVLFFGWLGGFGRFFGGMFSKSKKTRK